MTQGRRLIKALKRKAMTYGEMQRLGISTSPQKRVMECLQFGEYVDRTYRVVNGRKLLQWRVRAIK